MRRRRCLGLLATLASLSGCSDETRVTTPERVARTDGGAVALSRDERVAVVANRSAGVVTVLSLNPALGAANMVTGKVELDMGEGSEPWAAVTGADDDTAYVVLRKSRTVVRINSLRDQPTLDPSTVSVGSEPSDIAISPSGEMLFVSSWAEGTIQMIATAGMVPGAEISLNDVLAKSGLLGSLDPRPALAHPYALAITDDGDDDDYDETLYATEFFSQPLYGVEQDADFGYLDRNRQGLVYSVDLATGQTGPLIQLAPFQQTGFVDGEGRMTGCFPNQLYGAAVHDGHLYVTSMCTSPRGPLGPRGSNMQPTAQNFKTLFHPAVFVVDIASGQELPGASRLLTRQLSDYYDAGEEDSQARMPLIPNDIAFRAREDGETANAYVTALGADAVFRLDYDAGGTLLGIGSPGARYIDTGRVSSLPVGVAVSRSSSPPFALVALDAVQRVSVIDLASERVTVVGAVDQTEHALVHLESPENVGRRLFVTGRDVWSYKGQAWGSCESCHPGGLSDGVVWSFSRGPRRTLSAASAYDKASAPSERMRRLMLWGANIDEVHDIEGIVRSVTGGVGAVLWSYASQPSNDCRLLFDGSQPVEGGSLPCRIAKRTTHLHNGLNGALAPIVTGKGCASDASECNESGAPDWNYIDAYIRWQRVPRAPVGLSTAAVQAGRELFRQARCSGCHAGAHWSLSALFYTPGAEENGVLPYVKPATLPALGRLLESTYTVDPALLPLNPPAAAGSATFRPFAPAETTDAAAIDFVYDAANWGNDQLQCALRDVGTFPAQPADAAVLQGKAPEGAPVPIEVRADMKTLAQGQNGFNIPPLFGLSVGAPFFHAGNARTLEELFDGWAFAAHHRALAPDLLDDAITRYQHIAELVAFLLSIDESTEPEAPPDDGLDYDFCR